MERINSRNEMLEYIQDTERRMQEDKPVSKCVKSYYQEVENELPEDMKDFMQQYILLFGIILEEAENNDTFAAQVILLHKSWKRLFKYMDKKARPTSTTNKNFRPQCAMIDSETLREWMIEYYALDDKEEVEKELAEKAAEKEKAEKFKQKMEEYKKKTTTEASKLASKATSSENDIPEIVKPVEKKKSAKDCEGQINMFSFFTD